MGLSVQALQGGSTGPCADLAERWCVILSSLVEGIVGYFSGLAGRQDGDLCMVGRVVVWGHIQAWQSGSSRILCSWQRGSMGPCVDLAETLCPVL